MKIGAELYSIRREMDADFEGSLKKIRDMGYDSVEFAGLFGKSADEVRDICVRLGLEPIAAHVSLNEMLEQPDIFATYADIGCKYVDIPWLGENDRPGHPGFEAFLENTKKLAVLAKEHGIWLGYHNHDFEFEKVDGKYGLDMIYDAIPADMLKAELDTCWINVGGADPVEYVRKYSGRVDVIHLKDFAGKKSENMYALIGLDEDKKVDSVGDFEFRPLGMGLQDMPAIVAAAAESGTEWLIIEMDEPSLGLSPFECMAKSIDYLKTIV